MRIMSVSFILFLTIFGLFWWLGIYLYTQNIRSKIGRLLSIFLLVMVLYGIAVTISPYLNFKNYLTLWYAIDWTYIIAVALFLHISILLSGTKSDKINIYLVTAAYTYSIFLIYCQTFTDLFIVHTNKGYYPGIGYTNPRGILFWTLIPYICICCSAALRNYYFAIKQSIYNGNTKKYILAALTCKLYLIIGPAIAISYYFPHITTLQQYSSVLFIIAFLPMTLAILFYRLISDVDYIFNWREFMYLSITMGIINGISGTIFALTIAPRLGELAYILMPLFLVLTITTHGFYDWLATFIRDLVYNAGHGFSLITNQDVLDITKNFHNPEKLETNSILKFKYVKENTKNSNRLDAAKDVIREAIEDLKQPDFPRRTKQNLKYQILKMTTLDEAEEGQILWELGFEGYPLKIMDGENHTRKPLFKIEAMSDYTATSRNAFIALKKEAIHDLGARLSYLERAYK